MSAFNARSASALLSPAPSAMLSTSSDLFTLASEMCACSKEVERIYNGTSSISTLRVRMKFTFDAPFTFGSLLRSVLPASRSCTRSCRARVYARMARNSRRGYDSAVTKWWISHTHTIRTVACAARTTRERMRARACRARANDARTKRARTTRENRARPATTRSERWGRVARYWRVSRADPTSRNERSPALRAGLRV